VPVPVANADPKRPYKPRLLRPRSLISVAAAAAAAAVSIVIWLQLVTHHQKDIGEVTQTVSYATRSELARRLETQFSAFRRVALYWAVYGGQNSGDVPRLASDAKIELDHFEGVEFLAWRYPNRELRFFTEAQTLDLTRTPSAEEWTRVETALQRFQNIDHEALIGPQIGSDGKVRFVLYVPVTIGNNRAELITSIDVTENLQALLQDEAPGYSIRVSCCDGAELYRRGEGASGRGAELEREGWIELSPGARWLVSHTPTQSLVDDLDPWALDATLIMGLIMSLLLGAFVHETLRADSRARAAAAAQRETEAANTALESQVAARTQSLSEALADINTINLSVTHDLRSPLQTIVLGTQALQIEYGSVLGEAGSERLLAILASTDYMNTVMDRVLSFSQASTFEYQKKTVDMRRMAESVAAELSRHAPARTSIEVHDLPPCSADPTMINILFTNLIDNALKYAPAKGRPGHVEIGSRADNGEIVYFVKDDGAGFNSADAERLFEPLERLQGGAKAKGLGLGLAIVKRIVNRHGGRIWAESAPGEGATFSFTLPAATC
jgi:signal transduction histidine kinase